MKIGVCLKQVPATDTRIRIDNPAAGIATGDVKWEINPYDEFALEQGLLLRDAGTATEVIVFTVGGADSDARIRDALARGADRAVRLDDPSFAGSDSLGKARILAAALKREGVSLVLAGKQAADDDNGQVPSMIAELLDWPQVLVVDRLEVSASGIKAWRLSSGGARDVVEAPLPAVVSCTKGLCEPRYASLKGIMAAKKKAVDVVGAGALGLGAGAVGAGAAVAVETAWSVPTERSKGRMLQGDTNTVVKELVRLLREEAKVI